MKKVIFGFFVLTLMFATSCKKSSSNPGGSWSFKGASYNTTTCVGLSGDLTASNLASNASNISTYGTVDVQFYNSLPTTNGTYTVVSGYATAANQVAITASINGTTGTSYYSTGGNGSNQTVSVTVSNGKVSVNGSGITLYSTGSDSSALSIGITQLQ